MASSNDIPTIPLSLESKFPDSQPVPTLGRQISKTPSLHDHDEGHEWNEVHEKLLKGWGERSQYYSIMHDRAGKHYEKLNKWMGLPCKILLSVISSVEFAQLSQAQQESNTQWSSYLVGFIAIVGLIIELSQDFLAFESKSTKHFLSAISYDKLYMEVASELSHPRNRRINVKSYLRSVKRSLCDIKDTSPDIPIKILDKYLKEVDQTILLPVPITVNETNAQDAPNKLVSSPSSPSLNKQQQPQQTQPQPSSVDNVNGGNVHINISNPTQDQVENDHVVPNDLQDEFEQEMERQFQARKSKFETHQLNRFDSTMNNS